MKIYCILENLILYMKQGSKKNQYQHKSPAKFKFNKHQIIGAPDAETDRYLSEVFVENGAYDVLSDIDSPKCIIIGRTGSGKSALIKRLLETEEKTRRLAPESMSLKHLSNSTILDHLRSIKVNLNFFYKVLWKHVFIVEILKLYLGETETGKATLLQRLFGKSNGNDRAQTTRKKALSYFEKWSDEFWLKTEYRIREIEQDLEKKIRAEVGGNFDILKAGAEESTSINTKKIEEVKHKAEKIISEIQADELYDLIEILKNEVFNTSQRKFFIVIDDLDKEWVSPQIVYDLVAAMIEVVKEFQEKFTGVKIVIALRDNLHHLIFTGKEHRGGQREKYSNLYLNLEWEKPKLRALVDKRVKHLSHNSINIENLFDKQSKNFVTGFDYILERTYLRPRDIISFINKIIENADNKFNFTHNLIKRAEPYYSVERMQALEDEWEENYGEISKACKFLIGIHNGFNFYNIKEEMFAEIIVENDFCEHFKGELKAIAIKWKNSKGKPDDFKDFLRELLYILYRIGIIGVKRGPSYPLQFFYDKEPPITSNDFDNNTKIYVHKSLYSALKINVKEQEADYLD